MHVVVVAWAFPPANAFGSHRAVDLVQELHSAGADVTVVCASREAFLVLFGADGGLESQIPSTVRLERVPFAPDQLWPVVSDWPKSRISHPRMWEREAADRDRADFPEVLYSSWLEAASSRLLQLGESVAIDLVIATGPPYVAFEVAHYVHERSGVPFVLDDRDSFLFDVRTGERHDTYQVRRERLLKYAKALQEYWCANPRIADVLGTTVPGLSDKTRVVESGWSPEMVMSSSRIRRRSGSLRVGLVGSITANYPTCELLRAWRYCRDSGVADELHVAGGLEWSLHGEGQIERQAARLVRADGVEFRGRLSQRELADLYSQMDALVYIREGGSLVTSRVVYEYIATGLPILYLSDASMDALRVLEGYPCLYPASLASPEDVADALRSALTHPSEEHQRDAALDLSAKLGREALLGPAVGRVVRGRS